MDALLFLTASIIGRREVVIRADNTVLADGGVKFLVEMEPFVDFMG